jgi:NADH dehydrogenase FAD-containing subunit
MTVLLRLMEFTGRGHPVTLVSSSAHHYYSGMGPGMLSGIYEPRQLRFNIRKMAEERGAAFVEDDAVRIDPVSRLIILASGRGVNFDVASFNTGSRVPLEPPAGQSDGIITVKPIINLHRARRKILDEIERRDLRIAVIGGGPAGVEIAANLWRLVQRQPHRAEILLIGGKRILGEFPERVRTIALDSLQKRNIKVMEGVRAQTAADGSLLLTTGAALRPDFIFIAAGVKPPPLFADSGLPTGDDGGLLVNSFLQCPAHPELFGGGDCISLAGNPLARVGVYAVRQNPILFHNLLAALEGGALQPFRQVGEYMLIMNMGDGTGIVWKRDRVWDGHLAFLFKDFIDRRFMNRFQVSGEQDEPNGDV